jgi:hypothetical protein
MRLRINTLINGEPICEVDFSASHLRLNLAFNGGIDAGDDPYTKVGEEAGIESRQLVKKFFTIAMGGDNELGALHACFKEGINKENFQKLKERRSRSSQNWSYLMVGAFTLRTLKVRYSRTSCWKVLSKVSFVCQCMTHCSAFGSHWVGL